MTFIPSRIALFVFLLTLAACGPGGDSSGGSASGGGDPSSGAAGGASAASDGPIDMAVFAEAFEIVDTLIIEETDEAMVVTPTVTADGGGLLIVAEPQEAQVNVFGTDGRLRAVYGGRGEGPGELAAPVDARRTLDGGIVVSDIAQQSLVFYGPGDGGPQHVPMPRQTVVSAQDLGGGRYLLATAFPAPLLHVWDRETGDVADSFFEPGLSEGARTLSHNMGGAMPAIAGDTIWAVWTLGDTLYRFDLAGELVSTTPLSLPRPIGDLPEEPPTNMRAFRKALEKITQVGPVFALANGEKAIVSMQERQFGAVWDLLIVGARGETVWRAANMPQLLAVDGDLLYFDAEPAVPGTWIVARRRSDA